MSFGISCSLSFLYKMVLTHNKLNRKLSWALMQILLQSCCLGLCHKTNLSVFCDYRIPTKVCLSHTNKSHLSKQQPVERNFSDVSSLEKVGSSETFAVEPGLGVISRLQVVKVLKL